MFSSYKQKLCLLFRVINYPLIINLLSNHHVIFYSSKTTFNSSDDPSLLNVSVPNISKPSDATFDNQYDPSVDNKYDPTFSNEDDASISNDTDECIDNRGCDGLFYKSVGKRHAIYSLAKGIHMLNVKSTIILKPFLEEKSIAIRELLLENN